MAKREKLEELYSRMKQARAKSLPSTDWSDPEGAHGDADQVLVETIQVLAQGGRMAATVDAILQVYNDPAFQKW
jgi:hypothetical protein